jgi:hypothetical protein
VGESAWGRSGTRNTSRTKREAVQRDISEAAALNSIGTRAWDVAYVSPTRQKLGSYSEPRDSQGRLCGSGYEVSDQESSQEPGSLTNPAVGQITDSIVIEESLGERVAKRRRLASPDEVEAEMLNSLG